MPITPGTRSVDSVNRGTEANPVRPQRTGWVRWLVCSLLFFATTLNYVDRQTIAILKPTLSGEFHWNEIDYANVVLCFQTAYAVGYVIFGRVIDKLGARLGYSIAVFIWACAQIFCAFATSLAGFSIMLFALGLGESGNFPAALKAVAEWFPHTVMRWIPLTGVASRVAIWERARLWSRRNMAVKFLRGRSGALFMAM